MVKISSFITLFLITLPLIGTPKVDQNSSGNRIYFKKEGVTIREELWYGNFKALETHYKGSKPVKTTYWNRYKEKMREIIYKDGIKSSVTTWYKGGKRKHESHFTGGRVVKMDDYNRKGNKLKELYSNNGEVITTQYSKRGEKLSEQIQKNRIITETHYNTQKKWLEIKTDLKGCKLSETKWSLRGKLLSETLFKGCKPARITRYYRRGGKSIEQFFTDGVMKEQVYYLRTGKILKKELFKDGKQVKTVAVTTFSLSTEEKGAHLHPNGIKKEFHQGDYHYQLNYEGYPLFEKRFKEGKLIGYRTWYPGGEKKLIINAGKDSLINQNNTITDGEIVHFYPSGLEKEFIRYRKGEKIDHRTFFPGGMINKVIRSTGETITHHPNGITNCYTTPKHQICKYPNGETRHEILYHKGEKGREVRYFSDGTLKFELLMEPHSGYKRFYHHGVIQRSLLYRNKKVVREELFHPGE